MQKKVTIYDVATKAGVSPSTVSRVLNDSPKVAERTRSCVRDAMQELGYVPDRTARALAQGRERQQRARENGSAFAATQPSRENKLLCFEGAWDTKERDAVQRAIFRSQTESTPWLCVKTRLQGTKTFIALKLHGPHKMVMADSARDLATRILSQEGVDLLPRSAAMQP